jgi:hypothetical protein
LRDYIEAIPTAECRKLATDKAVTWKEKVEYKVKNHYVYSILLNQKLPKSLVVNCLEI